MNNQYRKKPVVIEAVHFTEAMRDANIFDDGPLPEGVRFGRGHYHRGDRKVYDAYYYIETLEGNMTVSVGDWIITGVKGERYPCKPDIFAATYEAATPAATTSGAAGTIDEFLYAPGGMMPAQPGRGGWHRTQDVVAAMAADRKERAEIFNKAMKDMGEKFEAELSRLRAAPVVGEAVANGDMLRDMLAIQEACGLHTDEYAPGSVIEYIKELEADTAPHAAKEAGNHAAAECDPAICPLCEKNYPGIAALTRTTNKENDRD